jgi:lysophospholipase L1-like esterase
MLKTILAILMAVCSVLIDARVIAANPAVWNTIDYDGDRKADLAVYSEERGELSVAMSARNYFLQIFEFSEPNAVAVPGDFDGDGIADPAVYCKGNGLWQIFLSDCNYSVFTNTLGGSGYETFPADYDGDGKSDLAVYQKSSGYWQIIFSSNSASAAGYWGGPGYNPVPADYDGDSRADIVVYHETAGDWQALLSSGQPLGTYYPASLIYGGPSFVPVPADYDNDGRTDIAVYDQLASTFFAALSTRNYATVSGFLTQTNSHPVIADYDGDRKADLMVYSQAMGTWQGALSSNGYQLATTQFGGPGWAAVQNEWRIDLQFLAFGDSITYGEGTSSDGPDTAYPKLLETRLKDNYSGYFVSVNGGNPGETTEEGLERFSHWLDAYNPGLVLLMEGTNDEFFGDPYEQTEENLRLMVQLALTHGANVIIATIPPVISNSYHDRNEQQQRIVEFNPRIYRIADDYGIPVAAVFEAITAVPNWQNTLMDQTSGNHPNDAGHAVMRDIFYAIISAGLNDGTY